jgi:hypothetical protein
MRWNPLLVIAAILAAVSILSIPLRLPAQVVTIALSAITTVAGLVIVRMGDDVRIGWACVVVLLAGLSIVTVFRNQADQEKKYRKDKKLSEDRHAEDKRASEERHAEVLGFLRQTYEVSLRVNESLLSVPRGTLKYEVLSLSRDMLILILDRRGEDLPIPAGDYADPRVQFHIQIGSIYEMRFGERVRKAIGDLGERGLADTRWHALLADGVWP